MSGALVLTYLGSVSQERQLRACMDFMRTSGNLALSGLLRPGCSAQEAAAAVAAGSAKVVVAAYRDPALDLTGEVQAAGGEVRYVHNPRDGRLTVRRVLARLYTEVGLSPERIANVLDADLVEVKDHLRRAGVWSSRDSR